MVILVRKNGGQVLSISTVNTTFDSADPTYFQAIIGPTIPDGQDLGVKKIWTGSVMRNATAGEIAAFITAEATDLNLQQRTSAIAFLQSHPVFRKVLRAFAGVVVTQLNTLRQNPTTTFAAITEQQAEDAIVSAINAGTFD